MSVDGKTTSKSNRHKKLDAKFTDVTKCSCMVNLRMSFACHWHRAQKLPGLNLYPGALQRLWARFSSCGGSSCSCDYVTMYVLHLAEGKKQSWLTLQRQGFAPSCSGLRGFSGLAVNRGDTDASRQWCSVST